MDEIKRELQKVVYDLYGVEILVEMTMAPEGQRDGQGRKVDYATNVAMRLAGELKRAPREIAEEIQKGFLASSRDFEVEVAGPGFLNFISSDEYFKRKLGELEGDFLENIACDEYKGKMVVSEFSDPNPFKVLHVGHLYTSIVGEAVSRLVEFAGGEVKRANFGGDVGLHVAKTLYSLTRTFSAETSSSADALLSRSTSSTSSSAAPASLNFLAENASSRDAAETSSSADALLSRSTSSTSSSAAPASLNFLAENASSRDAAETSSSADASQVAGVLAECYVEGTRLYEEDEEAHKDIVYLNKMIYEIAEKGRPEKVGIEGVTWSFRGSLREAPRDELFETISKLYWWGREASYEYFREFYASIGLKFDKYYPESTVAQKGLSVVKEQLGNGVYEMSDGAVVFRGEPYGLHTRVFINKEGLPTYEAKDVGLIYAKWDDYHFDKSIVITGNDIIDYMKVVLTSVKQYNPKLVERTEHVTHGNVKLEGGVKMSSRKGNFLKAVDVLNMVNEALAQEQGERSEVVALGATKYAFLKYKIGGNIVFSPEESVSMSGNSGPYLQYACVRARKILSSTETSSSEGALFGRSVASSVTPASLNFLAEDNAWELSEYERNLIRKVLEYREVLVEAVEELAPHKVCAYLYELAQVFNRFYENVKVVGSEFEMERATLTSVYLATLTHGLNLLGIEIPERM